MERRGKRNGKRLFCWKTVVSDKSYSSALQADECRVPLPYSPPQASDNPTRYYSPGRQGSSPPAIESNCIRLWEQQREPSQHIGYSPESFYHPGQPPSMENQGHAYAYGPKPMDSSLETYGDNCPHFLPHCGVSGPMVAYTFAPGIHIHPFYHRCPAPPTKPIQYIRGYNSMDVLCGRGGHTNNHQGNHSYREMVKCRKDRYLRAKKRDKPLVASEIVELVRKRGGRFLQRCNGTDLAGEGLWVDIGDERAKEKACQALREGAPKLLRELGRERSALDDRKEEGHQKKLLSSTNRDLSGQDEKRPPKPKEIQRSTADVETRDDAVSKMGDMQKEENQSLVVRPCSRLMRRPVQDIELSELSSREQQMYLCDFLPPHPNIKSCALRKKRIVIASRPRSNSDEGEYLNNQGATREMWEV